MEKRYSVILDSTVYKQNPKGDSESFKLLKRIIRANKIKLFIPTIIQSEYLTWIDEKTDEALIGVRSAVEKLDKFVSAGNIYSNSIVSYSAGWHLKEMQDNVKMAWEEFKIETNAVVLPIGTNYANAVMNSYFSGEIPFCKRKSREDIPDAFIFEAIKEIIGEEKEAHFITQDKRFAENISKTDHLFIYNDLMSFLQNIDLDVRGSYFETESKNELIKRIFSYFEEEISEALKKALSVSFEGSETEEKAYDFIPGECDTYPTLVIDEIDLNMENIVAIDDYIYIIPFNSSDKADYTYKIDIKDFHYIDEANKARIIEKSEYLDDKYEITERFKIEASGYFSIKIANSNVSEWKGIEGNIEIKIDNSNFLLSLS